MNLEKENIIIGKKGSSNGKEIEDYVFSVTEEDTTRIEKPFKKKRSGILWWLMVFSVLVLAGRVSYLNIIKGSHYREVAQGNKIRSISIKAPRGKIYDRSGEILVNNIPSQDVVIIPADLPKEKKKISILSKELSQILNINEGEILAKIELADKFSFNPLLIKENISQDESLFLTEKNQDLPGVVIERTAIREYINSSIFSHVLGYEGKIEKEELEENPDYSLTDYIGKQGIEKSYEKYLKGKNGAFQVEVDSLGNIKKERGIIDPEPGYDLILSIDAKLQKKVFDSLLSVLELTETKTAAAVAINPKNGEVLALVSLPSFDNNLFASGISQENYVSLIGDPDKPLFNRAISGEYPPGSVLKPLVAVAGLSEGVVNENTSVSCTGAINIGSYRFGDWKVHGTTDLKKAIAESCDVFFYSLGGGYGHIEGLGMNRMKKYENAFGLGRKTGIDIPGEEDGFIPDEQWKQDQFGERWYIGNSYHAAIGQGFVTTTPLQLANYISAIANKGNLYQPKVVSKIKKEGNEIESIPSNLVNGNLPSPDIIEVVREGMRMTVTEGTARSLNTLPVEVAGKTGTAQFGADNETHAWFSSFAPYDNPEIAMVILVEGGGEGHSSAVPATKEIYEWYFSGNN